MKKVLFAASLASAVVFGFSSCEKIKDKLFPNFDTDGGTVVLSVPVMSNTTNEGVWDQATINFNLDSVIKKYTNNQFSISNANSIKIKTVTLTVLDGNQQNNISNFESVKLAVSSNSNSTPANVISATLQDINQPAVINGNDVELKSYLTGSQITYKLSGKMRRATTQKLTTQVDIEYSVK